MGYTRYDSFSCDVSGCHTVVVTEWPEHATTLDRPPQGWLVIQPSPNYSIYLCEDCSQKNEVVGLLNTLFPLRVVGSIDLGPGLGAYTSGSEPFTPNPTLVARELEKLAENV